MACLINDNLRGVFRTQPMYNEFASPLKKNSLFFLSVYRGPYTYLGKVKKSRGGYIVIKGVYRMVKVDLGPKDPPP